MAGGCSLPFRDRRDAGRVLAGRLTAYANRSDTAVVAPDLGAVKLAREHARLLQVPMAFVHKTRLSGHDVEAHGVIGGVRSRTPLIVDDMLSTGGTIAAAVGALCEAGALEPMTVAVTHPLLVGHAHDVLRRRLPGSSWETR